MRVVTKVKLYQESRKKDILGKDHYSMSSPHAVAALGLHFLRGDVKESMLAVAVNAKNDVLAVYTVFSGTINSAAVSARDVMQFGVLNNAASLFIIHNHPSGNTKPSQQDIDFTRRLYMASELMDMELLDHVVISDDDVQCIQRRSIYLPARSMNNSLQMRR